MKNFVFLSLAILSVGCGSVPKDTFVIEGRVPALADSTMLILLHSAGADTTYVAGGSFSFRNRLSEKDQVTLYIPPPLGGIARQEAGLLGGTRPKIGDPGRQ